MKGNMCPICDQGTLKKEVIEKIFEYKGQSITIPDYVVYHCNVCNESIVDKNTLKESGKILKDFQRKVDGLLTGEEIRKIRKNRC